MNFESEKTTWMRDSKNYWVSVIEVEKEMKETHEKAKDGESENYFHLFEFTLAVTLTITWLLLPECIECRESQNESSGMFINYPERKEAKKP